MVVEPALPGALLHGADEGHAQGHVQQLGGGQVTGRNVDGADFPRILEVEVA